MSDKRRVVALDPGGTTGVAIYASEFETIECRQLDGEHHLKLLQLLHEVMPDVIIYEKFHHRAMIQKDTASKPVEYIGVIKLYAQQRTFVELVPQEASQAKHFFIDAKIKTLGLWHPGQRHAMDALRHFLHWMTFTQNDHQFLDLLHPARRQ